MAEQGRHGVVPAISRDDPAPSRLSGVVELPARSGDRLDMRDRGFEAFAADAGERLRRAPSARTASIRDATRGPKRSCGPGSTGHGSSRWTTRRATCSVSGKPPWPSASVAAADHTAARDRARRHRRGRRGLDEALIGLSRRERTVALLVHGYRYSYAEVADATGTSVASVRNDLHRAMKRLRRKLDAT